MSLVWSTPEYGADNAAVATIDYWVIKYNTVDDDTFPYRKYVEDGTALTDTIFGMASGTYYLKVFAVDTDGHESPGSPLVTKVSS